MDASQQLILLILACTVGLFLWGRWRHDIVALAALLACVVTGLTPAADAFVGFGHPAVITVAAVLILTGSPEDLRGLGTLLDDDDPTTRAMIADAFLRRGRRSALIARADDDIIFPFALQAVTTNDPDAVRRVLALAPPNDELVMLWMDTVAELASATTPDRILELDDQVGATPHASDLLRTRLLSGAIAERDLDTTLHRRILKRLVPMLLEQDAAASALTHIRGLDPESLDDDLIALRFISAIRARLYDDAASMQDGISVWILAYEDTLASRPESAPDLRDEIVRRFNPELTPQLRTQLGLAQDPLMSPEDDGARETMRRCER